MGLPDQNFNFRMPGELREAATSVSEIEDRSLSKVAIYLMWAGFERYCKEKRLLSPFEVKQLSEGFKNLLVAAGLIDTQSDSIRVPVAEANQIDKQEKTAPRKKTAK